jgi:hypothetical protein
LESKSASLVGHTFLQTYLRGPSISLPKFEENMKNMTPRRIPRGPGRAPAALSGPRARRGLPSGIRRGVIFFIFSENFGRDMEGPSRYMSRILRLLRRREMDLQLVPRPPAQRQQRCLGWTEATLVLLYLNEKLFMAIWHGFNLCCIAINGFSFRLSTD